MKTEEKTDRVILSDRENETWIPSCPIFLKRITLSRKNSEIFLSAVCLPCGDFGVSSYTVNAEYKNLRRESVGSETLTLSEGKEVLCKHSDAVYAELSVISVKLSDGKEWACPDGLSPVKLPEQSMFWQTDPLYPAIKAECGGVTDAKYVPDSLSGGWRCTCGRLNLDSADTCGSCKVSKNWLDTHLDRENLEKKKSELDSALKTDEKKKKKKSERALSDKAKASIILSSAVAAVILVLLTVFEIVPGIKYSSAEKLSESGEFDKAIEIYSSLGSYRDSKTLLEDTVYKQAQALTGLDEVKLLYSADAPWFEIDESGILSFYKERYTGRWYEVEIPDIFDGIIVRSLEENFFMNCSELYKVTLSECIETIGDQTFYNCSSLTSVKLPSKLKEIGPRTFINCTSLEEIEIPDSVTYLGIRAFNNCTALKSVILGKGITAVESYTFSMCSSLRKVTFSSPISSVGEYAFTDCTGLKKIFCRFSESEWVDPALDEGNEMFLQAEKIFN